ncbi:HDOD domain-containing protein [Aquabacterium sp.]|uniref:HDOD domain-containing protein n=1 Tax=Aquabacterium sp. TaxID=1872578 RepID=UPI0019B9F136|nr:HDOD domain-containing protein [Aquabacterium sp.]MBC7702174.1 HDOD domain-containing protein [Aquabacterium sp.]
MSATSSASEVSGDNPSVTLDYLLRRMRHKSDFPTLSASVTRIQSLSESENESLGGLCDEILKDVALTQKLLRLINTPHYRRGGGDAISTVSRAVSLIGLAGVRNLALSLMLVEHMEDKQHAQQLKEEFLRTVMAGTLASELCISSRDAEDAFIGSLFRNLGRLLAEFYLPDEAQEVRGLARPAEDGTPAQMTEAAASAQVMGMPFEDLGQAVGQTWALPDRLLAVMRAPTGSVPSRSQLGKPEHQAWLATLANAAADAMLFSAPEALGQRLTTLNHTYAVALELKSTAVQEAAGRARKRLTELTQALKMEFPKNSQAERMLDHFYVDAPNAGQTGGPGPEALGLVVAGTDGELGADKIAMSTRSADVLTSGIQDITNTMVDSFKLNDILRMILETIYRALDCRRVIFCMRDAKTMRLIGRIGLGEGADGIKTSFQIPLTVAPGAQADLFTAVSLKGADTLISDASAEAIRNRLPVWFRDRVQAPTFLLLPMSMKHQGKEMVLGLIYADKAQAGSLQISEKDLSLLRTLRNQALMAFKQTTGG